jgi:AcrR family transcriptional regulator
MAAAVLADEVGLENVTMGLLAERLGVRAPSLYKHVGGQSDLQRRLATLALTEISDRLAEALDGTSGRAAIGAAAHTLRAYATDHPGRYAATVRLDASGPDDPVAVAGARVVDVLAAALSGYGVSADDTVHALRMLRSLLHGFAVLEAAGGFQLATDVDASFAWLVDFVDRGLRS